MDIAGKTPLRPIFHPLIAGLTISLLTVLNSACIHGPSAGPPGPFALVSGFVSAPPTPGRVNRHVVTATNLVTHRSYRARTDAQGVFALGVPAGTYHLGVSLSRDEVVVDLPSDFEVDDGEIKDKVTIVLGPK